MTKKKPDFLRDLDTAIMDELTGGGIKGNAAGLVGTLTQIKEIKQLCGLPFCGYMAKLETVRPSGVPDEVTVVFAEDVPYRACNGIEFDVMGCALILYHGSIKERGFSRRAERQRIWFTFFAERIRRSTGKVWGLRQIK